MPVFLNKETGFKVMFTDKDKVTVCKKEKNTSLFVGEEISDKLIDIIEKKNDIQCKFSK